MDKLSFVDRIKNRLRTNPIFATVVALGFVVVWVATFTDAIRKLRSALPDAPLPAVAGRWESDVLQGAKEALNYRYVFELRADGPRVTGSARRLMPSCERSPGSGFCEGHGRAVAVLDGTVDRQGTSFRVYWGELPGVEAWSWSRVTEQFRGRPDGARMRFTAQDDRNNPPIDFVAARAAP
jgi:hypothetical protein